MQNKLQTDEPTVLGNHLSIPKPMDVNPNLLSPEILCQRRGNGNEKICKILRKKTLHFFPLRRLHAAGSRRPSILPVAETMTGSSLNISVPHPEEDGDESEDELEDEVPWRSPSEKIA